MTECLSEATYELKVMFLTRVSEGSVNRDGKGGLVTHFVTAGGYGKGCSQQGRLLMKEGAGSSSIKYSFFIGCFYL